MQVQDGLSEKRVASPPESRRRVDSDRPSVSDSRRSSAALSRKSEDLGGSSTNSSLDLVEQGELGPPHISEATALIDQEAEAGAHHEAASAKPSKKDKPVSWKEIPRKSQLLILTLARLAEPLSQTSISSYMFFMLKSFDASLSDSDVADQAGMLTGAFTAAQCLTAVWFGRLADREWMGRKRVLLIGLAGNFIATMGFGFSKSFASLMFFRVLGGALNGNVGVMRTMISEIIKEKKYQTKAFLVLPITFNIGILIGPLLGGWLQDPINTFPSLFGPRSAFGGEEGVRWMADYPYALPNILSCCFYAMAFGLLLLGLEETLIDRQGMPDIGLKVGRFIRRTLTALFRKRGSSSSTMEDDSFLTHEYSSVPSSERHARQESYELRGSGRGHRAAQPSTASSKASGRSSRPKLPFRRIFTTNVISIFIVHALLHVHISTFNSLWFIFLSTPRFDPSTDSSSRQQFPFHFTGGLGMPPPTIGFAVGIIGMIGLCLQFGIYSRVTHRLGLVRTLRVAFIFCFPVVYIFIPYLAIVPTPSGPPAAANGPLLWTCLSLLLALQVFGRTFALPIMQILVNNCSPHPSVLGTVHGMGQSVSSGARALGPLVWSFVYGVGLKKNIVGLAWWLLAAEAACAALASSLAREGNGHEIILEGDSDVDE